MGWRFNKSFRIAPGVRINLSRKGVGTSVGVPGTGLRYVTSPGTGKGEGSNASAWPGCLAQVFIALFKVVGLAFVAIVLVSVYMAIKSPPSTYRASDAPAPGPAATASPAAIAPAFRPGDRVTVTDADRPEGGGVHVVVQLQDLADFEAAQRAVVGRIGRHPGEARRLMYEAGKLKLCDNRSEAEVVEVVPAGVKVRLTSGECRGLVGWVPMRYLGRR